jgi:hypothetical protein
MPSSANKVEKHPSLNKLLYPNPLLNSKPVKEDKKLAPFTVSEHRLMAMLIYEVLQNPDDTKYYHIKYSDIFKENTLRGGTGKKLLNTLRHSLHYRYIVLDKKYAKKFIRDTEVNGEASFVPFTTMVADRGFFKVVVHETFKEIIRSRFDSGYTKLDLDMIKSFTSSYSHLIYPFVRIQQAKARVWEEEMDSFREIMMVQDKYLDHKDLRKNVLEKMYSDFKGTYSEFNYEYVIIGKKITRVRFTFKNGPLEEKSLPVGSVFKWEVTLKKFGLYDATIIEIRHRVKAREKHKLGFEWDEDYVVFSVEAFIEEIKTKKRNTNRKQMVSPANYLHRGLMEGWWIQEVSEKKERGQLSLLPPSEMKLKVTVQPGYNDQPEPVVDTAVTDEWKALYAEVKNVFPTFEGFLSLQNKVFVDGKVVDKKDITVQIPLIEDGSSRKKK